MSAASAARAAPSTPSRPLADAAPPLTVQHAGGASPPSTAKVAPRWPLFVFVLFWVLLGVGLLLVALRGGARGSRRGRRASGAAAATRPGFLLALLVLGIAVPVAVVATVDNRDSIPSANVSNLTPLQKHGRDLFGGAGQCKNATRWPRRARSRRWGRTSTSCARPTTSSSSTIKTGRANGNGAMAKDLVQGKDAQAVAAFVAAAVNQPVPKDVPTSRAARRGRSAGPREQTRRKSERAENGIPRKVRDIFPSDRVPIILGECRCFFGSYHAARIR